MVYGHCPDLVLEYLCEAEHIPVLAAVSSWFLPTERGLNLESIIIPFIFVSIT